MFTLNKVIVSQDGISMATSRKNDPYSSLKAYFDYLMEVTPAKQNEVMFSPPYVDAWGLGKKANITLISLSSLEPTDSLVLCLYTRHQILAGCST